MSDILFYALIGIAANLLCIVLLSFRYGPPRGDGIFNALAFALIPFFFPLVYLGLVIETRWRRW